MSKRDDADRGKLEEDLSVVARERSAEVETWWTAAERRDQSLLPEGSPPIEALRPLDDDERARMTQALFGAMQPPLRAVKVEDEPKDAREDRPRVARIPWRRRFITTAGIAIAAAATFFALRPNTLTAPQYTLVVTGGDQTFRSSESKRVAEAEYREGSRLELVLQPETATDEALDVRAFVVVGEEVRSWPAPIERGRGGSFRIVAEIGTDLVVQPGPCRLVLFVGPVGDLPSKLEDGASANVRRLEYRFVAR